jgi:hypothetical protein
VFDLDDVVTFRGRIHEAARKSLFEEYRRARAARTGEPFEPFDAGDFRDHVDGRSRENGVQTFLASRGIELPCGSPSDSPDRETVCGLGNRKPDVSAAVAACFTGRQRATALPGKEPQQCLRRR